MTWADAFWLRIHEYRTYFRIFQIFLIFMLVLTGVTFVLGQPGSASYTLAVVNSVLILALGALVSVISWYSARRRAEG